MTILSKLIQNNSSISEFIHDDICNVFNKIIEQIYPPKDPRLQTSVKYKEIDYIKELTRFVTSGSTYWSKFKSPMDIHKKHKHYCSLNAYEHLYSYYLNKYAKLVPKRTYKKQMIDTKFVKNILGTECVDRNPNYKNKNGFKISQETDVNGVWFSLIIANSSESDNTIALVNYENRLININTLDVKDNNKHKHYYLSDMGYDSKTNRDCLKEKGYIPIMSSSQKINEI
jgi:hypothetical protein